MRKFLIYLIITFVILTVSLVGYKWWRFLTQPFIPQNISVAYELKPKTSAYSLTQDLHHVGVLSLEKAYLFTLLAYIHGDAHQLKAGEYLLEGGVTPNVILKKLTHGAFIWRRITFLEGWNFQQMKLALDSNPYLRHTTAPLTSEQIMSKLGHENLSPEGQFFPDTYFFTRGTSDLIILKKALALMQARLDRAWQHRANDLSYPNAYQALIAASIIEKESGFKPERPRIASVLLNRSQKGMPLQIDSTVTYGLGGVVHLTKADLKRMTPYNTYLNKGWPPTPIAMPSLDAINAALHPQNSNFLYFVANGERGHHFSVSLKEHSAAVMRYKAHNQKIHFSMTTYLLPLLFEKNKRASISIVPLKYPQLKIPYRVHYAS